MKLVFLSAVTRPIVSILKNATFYYALQMHQPTHRKKAGSREYPAKNGDIFQMNFIFTVPCIVTLY